MGKYSGVIEGLPSLQQEEPPSYKDRIEDSKRKFLEEHPSPSSAVIASEWVNLRLRKDVLEEEMKNLGVMLRATESLLEDSFEGDGITQLRLNINGDEHSVATQYEPAAVVEDKDAFRKWCIDQGLINEMNLWPSKTTSIVKEALLNGNPMPPGIGAFRKTKIVWR